MFKELDQVRLLAPLGDQPAGAEGTVVHCWTRGDYYEVEFPDGEVLTVEEDSLEAA